MSANEGYPSFEHYDFNPQNLPPAGLLSLSAVTALSYVVARFYIANPVKVSQEGARFFAQTNIYGVRIEGQTAGAVDGKSTCIKYWRRKIERAANLDRVNWEAARKIVGGPDPINRQIYCSNVTLARYIEKIKITENALEQVFMVNTETGELFSMAELAKESQTNRFNELYFIAKNFEVMAKEKNMPWLFLTFTAPPEYHPNPSHPESKRSYKREHGVKASHDYIAQRWVEIRSLLCKRGIDLGPDTCFGFRTAETHKDGCVHWHLQVFIKQEFISSFIEICEMKFSRRKQIKIVPGDPRKGSAASYIFKYLLKEVEVERLSSKAKFVTGVGDAVNDEARENNDMASIRHSCRVKAAIRAMDIRQYDKFGVGGKLSLIKAINKVELDRIDVSGDRILERVKDEVWRNPLGLRNIFPILSDVEASQSLGMPVALRLIKEDAVSRYGEARKRIKGVQIGSREFVTVGRYKVLKSRGAAESGSVKAKNDH